MQPGSVGDLGGGATLAGAIAAALFRRERTGRGAIVDNSLYLFGIYLMSQSMAAAGMGLRREPTGRADVFDALLNTYRTRDDRWISLCLLIERWWPDLARYLDRPELIDDPRFADRKERAKNHKALASELETIFAALDVTHWKTKLATLEGVWAPLQSPEEVISDSQALTNGFVTEVSTSDGRSYLAGASPAQFDEAPVGELSSAPGYGEHSLSILQELGLAGEDIAALRERKIFL
jgi:crotonobetainyl-CoA:carnitine CoA-transferase CaiB-like acyl-CoA transferase